ncbi:MAG: preprotein translocase subunit SecG [SAR86 cluster bacterium]|uniref:Protein-export membrane protein SecG n=1 Tax=SAR86 cluster bacterium TaxID=2030880 RepID=A0A2A4MEM7_9GAMM|nr:MAG: preprotein translocase subunit SecG [SAR86 cluster bacterium]
MESIVVIVHVIVAVIIIGLVLLQQGKGADAGASFGAGASQTVFGASGTGNFLTRATTIAAAVFFATSLTLAVYAKNQSGAGNTAGLPIVNPDLIQNAASDLPQLDATSDASGLDVPALPVDDN